MRLAPVLIVHSPLSDPTKLSDFVEQCLLDEVELIAIVGTGCTALEDEIDGLIVGGSTDKDRYITTSAHPDESLKDVLQFADAWTPERASQVQQIRL